jgi:hypothetical protein
VVARDVILIMVTFQEIQPHSARYNRPLPRTTRILRRFKPLSGSTTFAPGVALPDRTEAGLSSP